MKIINLQQGSDEWLAFRQSKIGASESAAVMGFSPYQTPFELWEIKTGRKIQESNRAMEFGHMKETEIRERYEEMVEQFFTPVVVQSDDHEFMIASLDGISLDEKIILECKAVNKDIFAKAKEKNILPDHFISQGQHQLLCTGADVVVFALMSGGEMIAIDLYPDLEYQEMMLEKERMFYEEHMLNDEPPALTEKDYVDMSMDSEWTALEIQAKYLYPKKRELDKQWEQLKKKFIECSDDGNCRGDICTLTRVTRSGSIDYKRMYDDGIDIEKYRKPEIGCTRITIKTD